MSTSFCRSTGKRSADDAGSDERVGAAGKTRRRCAAGAALIAVCLAAVSGCTLRQSRIHTAREAFARGDLVAAQQSLKKVAESRRAAAPSAALDLAMVELASGNVTDAENRLRKMRDRFDALPSIAPVGEVGSLVSDDNVRQFRPAGYEEVMIRAMLAVCSLAGDATDAEAYALQASMKQEALARDAEQRGMLEIEAAYQPIALAPYLRGVLREATHHDYDDAVRAYQLVSTVQPGFAPAGEDIERAGGAGHSAPGHGVLYIIGCVGRGPVLAEKVAETTTASLAIASMVVNAQTNRDDSGRLGGPVLPNLASVKVPDVVIPPSNIETLTVRVDGTLYGATQTLTDVGRLASNQVAAEMPWTIARAVLRRATKEAIVAGARETLDVDGVAGSLLHFAAVTAWSATENADTRCWGLLPREIQVLRAELPAGDHLVRLSPMNALGAEFGSPATRSVTITDGRNSYLIAFAPDGLVHLAN